MDCILFESYIHKFLIFYFDNEHFRDGHRVQKQDWGRGRITGATDTSVKVTRGDTIYHSGIPVFNPNKTEDLTEPFITTISYSESLWRQSQTILGLFVLTVQPLRSRKCRSSFTPMRNRTSLCNGVGSPTEGRLCWTLDPVHCSRVW